MQKVYFLEIEDTVLHFTISLLKCVKDSATLVMIRSPYIEVILVWSFTKKSLTDLEALTLANRISEAESKYGTLY